MKLIIIVTIKITWNIWLVNKNNVGRMNVLCPFIRSSNNVCISNSINNKGEWLLKVFSLGRRKKE